MTSKHTRTLTLALSLALVPAAAAAEPVSVAAPPEARAAQPDVFARVAGKVISVREYESALAAGLRARFYHGRPPEGEAARFGREVGEGLVLQVLLAAEAERRVIEPDREAIAKQLAEYERRYGDSEQWRRTRAEILPRLTAELESRSRVRRLEAAVRAQPEPSEADARAYYASKAALFTEPEQVRLSLILLKVDPAAAPAVWSAAGAEAERLLGKLRQGEDFAKLARAHSSDPSASQGGDLGYVHRGMLPEAIERQFVDGLQPGQLSAPARLLEGIAIVRLDARKPPRLREYDEVARNARELLQRSRADEAWAKLKADLRAGAAVWLDESRMAAAGQR
jgi:parvulin-like peptidyl-prolyl isomerase